MGFARRISSCMDSGYARHREPYASLGIEIVFSQGVTLHHKAHRSKLVEIGLVIIAVGGVTTWNNRDLGERVSCVINWGREKG